MAAIKVYLVEDHPLHIEKASFILEKLGYELCGRSMDGKGVVQEARLLCPDVFILDIELAGDISGIELATKLREELTTPIIFLTSRQEEEVFQEAKDTLPDAFLQKPMTEESIKHAIELAVIRNQASATPIKQNTDKSMLLKVGDTLKKVSLKDIVYIEVSYKNYCDIHTLNGSYAVKSSLKELETSLQSIPLQRVHRTALVNIDYIQEIQEKEPHVKTTLGTIPLGNSYKKELKQVFFNL